jgi:DNA-binding NarL/FixJ family response regulator
MHMPSQLRLLVADDHAPFRCGLIDLLDSHADFHVVAVASNGAEAVELASALRRDGLDLVLMDIDMPVLDGIAATTEINAKQPDLSVIILTISTLDVDLFGALRAGAVGFLSKNIAPAVLVRTLRDFERNGALPMSRQMAAKMLGYFREQSRGRMRDSVDDTAGLTQREKQVLGMIAAGAHDREIALAFNVAETTIKTHVRSVLRKLHARNRTEAATRFQSRRPAPPRPGAHAG